MMELARYLAVSTACLCISYAAFRLLFRNSSNFNQQRAFLVSSVLFSMLFPVISIRLMLIQKDAGTLYQSNAAGSFGNAGLSNAPDVTGTIVSNIGELMPYAYFIIAAFFAVSMVFQLIRIFHLSKTSREIESGSLVVLENEKVRSPFSFLKWIFIPVNLTDEKERRSIIIHEKVHASQLHTIDNIIIETATVIMWFNPAIWMIKKSLRLIHEYLADEGTLNAGVEKVWYQALLINHVAEENIISIPSGFNNKLLKKRMIMMMKTKAPGSDKLGILSFIPLPLLLLLAVIFMNSFFPAESKAQKKEVQQDKTQQINEQTTNSVNPGYDTIKETSANQNSTKEIVVVGYGWQKHRENQRDTTMNYILDGVSVKSISDLNPDSIASVNVVKEDRLIIVRTKSYERKVKKISGHTGSITITNKKPIPDNVIYIIDGKTSTKEAIQNIDPNQIESVSVIKDKDEIKKYGSEEHDGIIVITTKATKK